MIKRMSKYIKQNKNIVEVAPTVCLSLSEDWIENHRAIDQTESIIEFLIEPNTVQ